MKQYNSIKKKVQMHSILKYAKQTTTNIWTLFSQQDDHMIYVNI